MEAKKIRELISEMTLEEKAALCTGDGSWKTRAMEHLGIPSVWMTDGPHGLRKQEGKTDHLGINKSNESVSFPAECAAAASFDREVLQMIGRELGKEGQGEHVNMILGPGLNMKRSPLCGRNFEYFSEDPYLAGEMGAAYVEGIQSQGVGACVKHFLANNQETGRLTVSSEVDERTLREIYLPAFEKVVKDAKPWAVMASYNRVNGTFATESREYMTELLRKEWGYDGMVVSDWGAVHDRAAAIAAGTDLTMPEDSGTNRQIVEAVESGKLSMELLDQACENILRFVFRADEKKLEHASPDFEHGHIVSRIAEEQSAVLLKNEDGILPLSIMQKAAFIGEFAEHPRFQGGGSSKVNPVKVSGALKAAGGIANVEYSVGYHGTEPDETLIREAVETAAAADAAVVFAGLPLEMETEGMDRRHMRLPESHNRLIEEVAKVQPNTVVVLHNGSPVEMPWADRVKGILEMYLGGEAVGEAAVDLLYGAVNPSGRLPETFPLKLEDNPSYLYYFGSENKVEYREGIYIGYRYYESKKQEVLFPFGHGLSYTNFSYSNLHVDREELEIGEILTVSVDVKNIGDRRGKEVVQLYVGVKECSVLRPVRELKGFEKVSLDPGEEATVRFELTPRDFSYWDDELHCFRMPDAVCEVQIGKSAHEIILQKEIRCVGEKTGKRRKLTMVSLISDMAENPVGAAFLKEKEDELAEGIIRSGVAGDVTGREITKEECKKMISGIYSQAVTVLKMFLPSMSEDDWQELLRKMNQ